MSRSTFNWLDAPDLSGHPCEICRGTGKMHVEDNQGRPLQEIRCSYCKGTANLEWQVERAEHRYYARGLKKLAILGYWGFIWLTDSWHPWALSNTLGNPYPIVAHLAFYLFGVYLLVWWLMHRPAPKVRKRALAHAPGFNEPKEMLMGGALLAGAALKHEWDEHKNQPHPPA